MYDFPTRLFHWCFSGIFVGAFLIAKTIDSESPIYPYHMMMGLTLGFLVTLRLIWGVVGTQHAKFSDFVLGPTQLLQYFGGILKGEKKHWAGHNPASSWAALIMMGSAFGSAVTGYLMTSGDAKENFEEIHEIFANTFMVVALLHVAGIILHSMRYKEMLGLSMIDGKKAEVSARDGIHSEHRMIGALLIGMIAAFGINLYRNYDSKSGMLNFFGTHLTLGESDSQGIEESEE